MYKPVSSRSSVRSLRQLVPRDYKKMSKTGFGAVSDAEREDASVAVSPEGKLTVAEQLAKTSPGFRAASSYDLADSAIDEEMKQIQEELDCLNAEETRLKKSKQLEAMRQQLRSKRSQVKSLRDDSSDDSGSPVPVKKHKKHKKKHKRKKVETDDLHNVPSGVPDVGGSPKGSIKLKFKIGRETLATKNVVTVQQEATDTIVNVTDEPWHVDDYDPTIVTKKPGDETSDEEKEWLNALEKGELNDYGELSKQKDPNLMTARQRAMKHGKQEEQLMELPSGYRQKNMTEEQLKKKQQRANKRKQMAHEKREKDKKQTLDRLLKKQESRLKGVKTGRGSRKTDVPKYHYSDTQSGISISAPTGYPFPFTAQKAEPPKPASKCGVSGCNNDKKYSCSKTGIPLCSLQCYKSNLLKHQLTLQSVTT